jgi:hypothetical protein
MTDVQGLSLLSATLGDTEDSSQYEVRVLCLARSAFYRDSVVYRKPPGSGIIAEVNSDALVWSVAAAWVRPSSVADDFTTGGSEMR